MPAYLPEALLLLWDTGMLFPYSCMELSPEKIKGGEANFAPFSLFSALIWQNFFFLLVNSSVTNYIYDITVLSSQKTGNGYVEKMAKNSVKRMQEQLR